MSLTLTNLDLELQDLLASTQNIKTDSNKRKRALNWVLDQLQEAANWMFTIRKTTFDYLTDILEYNVSNYLDLDDFKAPYLLEQMPIMEPRRFNANLENLAYRMKDGNYYLSVNRNKGTSKQIDGLGNLTADGEWLAGDDAANLAVDSNEYKQGSASLKFDIDVSASANNYATIYNATKTALDLSDFEDRSYFMLWVYLPSATNFTSITLRWGSDASNYWEKTVTTPVDAGSFSAGWNLVIFSWQDATETGSGDADNVDYFLIRLNYSASYTDQSNARIDDLRLNDRYQMDFEYFSTYMVKDTDGDWQERFEASTDEFLGPVSLKSLLVEGAYYQLLRKAKNIDKEERLEASLSFQNLLVQAIHNYGYTISKGVKRIMLKR